MITRGIREFVSRNWRAARESKDAYWGDESPAWTHRRFRIAEELRRQAVLTDATWPDASLRRQDVLFHVHLPISSAVPLQPAALELLTTLVPVLAKWGRWYLFDA